MSALNNANLSIGQLFNAVNTAAVSVDATFRVIGNVAQVAADKSGSWARVTRAEIITTEAERIVQVKADATLNIARRTLELKRTLERDPDLAAIYEQVSKRFEEAEKQAA